jgi:aquaporin Z
MNKYLTEFIGTFFLVLTICCNVIQGNPLAPVAIGAALMVMIYAGGHISGAHFNPAVTLGVTLRGKCTPQDAVAYIIFQIGGGVAAVFAAKFICSEILAKAADAAAKLPAPSPVPFPTGPAFVAELLFTFALVWVILNSATSKGTANNSFYGLAIGFTVLAGAFTVGGISGGAFNPAVALSATIAQIGPFQWSNVWVHILADFIGGALAALAFKNLSTEDAGA